jgi:hypothetical protein
MTISCPKVASTKPSLVEISKKRSTCLPSYLLDVLADQPPNVGRKTGAALVTRHMFPVSHRSLEAWELPTQHVNGRAVIPTATLFEVAYRKLAAAPVVMGGRRPATGQNLT